MTFLKELEECLMSVTCVRKKEAKPQYLNIQKYFGILPLGLVEIPKIKVSISIYGDTSEKNFRKAQVIWKAPPFLLAEKVPRP